MVVLRVGARGPALVNLVDVFMSNGVKVAAGEHVGGFVGCVGPLVESASAARIQSALNPLKEGLLGGGLAPVVGLGVMVVGVIGKVRGFDGGVEGFDAIGRDLAGYGGKGVEELCGLKLGRGSAGMELHGPTRTSRYSGQT